MLCLINDIFGFTISNFQIEHCKTNICVIGNFMEPLIYQGSTKSHVKGQKNKKNVIENYDSCCKSWCVANSISYVWESGLEEGGIEYFNSTPE